MLNINTIKKVQNVLRTLAKVQNSQPNISRYYSSNFQEESLFVNIEQQSTLDLDLIKLIQGSFSMKNLLDIYKDHSHQINPSNVYFLVREMQQRFHAESPKALDKIPQYNDLLQFIEKNLRKMPAYTLVEVLTLVRKSFQNGHLEFKRTLTLAEQINRILEEKSKEKQSQINAKLSSQIFLDLCHLKINGEYWVELTEKWLIDQQSIYFTSQTIFNFFRASEISFKKKQTNFYFNLSNKALSELSSFDIDRLCILFRAVCSIRLQFASQNGKYPRLISEMKEAIAKNINQNFPIVQGLNIISAYKNAPHQLDAQLLDNVIERMMKYVIDNKMNLRHCVNFFEQTSHLREGQKLNDSQIKIVCNSIYKQLDQGKETVPPSMILLILEGLISIEYNDSPLLCLIESICLKYEFQNLSFTMNLKILQSFLKSHYNVCKLRKQFFDRFNKSIVFPMAFDKILDLLYVLNYEIESSPNDHFQFNYKVDQLKQEAVKAISEANNKARLLYLLDIYGKNFSAQKGFVFKEINDELYQRYTEMFQSFSNNDISNSFMIACNLNIFGNQWSEFIQKQIKSIQSKELVSWIIIKYLNDPKKIYLKADIFLQTCEYSQVDKYYLLNEKIRCLLASPYNAFINKKGSAHPLISSFFDSLDPKQIKFKDLKINSGLLIKSQRMIDLIKAKTHFFKKAVIFEFGENYDFYNQPNQEFLKVELACFIIQHYSYFLENGLEIESQQIIIQIQKSFNSSFLESNQNFGFALLQKYLEITSFLYLQKIQKAQFNRLEISGDQVQFVSDLLIQKLHEVVGSSQANVTLNSIITLFTLQCENIIKIDVMNDHHLIKLFQKTLSSLSVSGFVAYLDEIRRLRQLQSKFNNNCLSSHQQIQISKFLKEIEYFYVSRNLGKQPFVIVEFLCFFAELKSFYQGPSLFNKIFSDILIVFPRLKVSQLQLILKSMGRLQLHHKQLLNLIFSNFSSNIIHFKSSYQDIIFNFAQLGYQQNKERISECLSIFQNDKMRAQIQMIWSIIFFQLQEEHNSLFIKLINEISFKEQSHENSSLNNWPQQDLWMDISSYCSLYDIEIIKNKNFVQYLDKQYFFRNQDQIIKQQVNSIFYNNTAKQDYTFTCCTGLIADLYSDQSQTVVLINQGSFVNYDKQTLSGRGILRERLFQKLKNKHFPQLNILIINGWKFENAGSSNEEKYIFLKEQFKE